MKKILFACTENKKRSQMAEAIFNHLAKNSKAESAGTAPANSVDPMVGEILAERGISFEPHAPKKITDEMLESADYIVSFGCLVPSMFPKDKFEEWVVADSKTPEEYRQARDDIFEKIEQFIALHNF
ncbi:MAG: low molecular weight phosphatase family protein [Candidatus Spechtbacterales bacterium]